MTTPFDPTKPVQCRNGNPARIIFTDAAGKYPIIALVTYPGCQESPVSFTAAGQYCGPRESPYDLINIVETRTLDRWVNIYPNDNLFGHVTPEEANRLACSDRVACIRITQTYTVGEGLPNV